MSGNSSDPRAEHRLKQLIERRKAEHDRFRDWVYHNATDWQPPPPKDNTTEPVPQWNLTFTPENWYNSSVQQHVATLDMNQPDQPHWRNLTGFLKGEWEMLNVSLEGNETLWSESRGNIDWHKGGKFEWNARENLRPEQKNVKNDQQQRTSFLRGTIEIKDEKDSSNLDMDCLQYVTVRTPELGCQLTLLQFCPRRVHLRESRSRLQPIRTESLKNLQSFVTPETSPLDIRQIVSLVPESLRNLTSHSILDELDFRIKRMQELLASHEAPSSEMVDSPAMNCTFALWGQLGRFPEGTTQEQVDEYEREMQVNTGRRVIDLPRPSINAIAYSQNCGLVLKLKNSSSQFQLGPCRSPFFCLMIVL